MMFVSGVGIILSASRPFTFDNEVTTTKIPALACFCNIDCRLHVLAASLIRPA